MTRSEQIGASWREEVVLKDGTPVELRLVRPEDKSLFRDGFAQLSPETRFRRFLSEKDVLTESDLKYLTEVDGVDHVAIGAAAFDEIGRYLPVGIARFVRLAERPDVAEPAVVVVDSWQGKGAGRILLERLVAAARERGIRIFRSEVLVGNEPMMSILERIGPLNLESAGAEGVVVCDVDLGAGAHEAAGPLPAILHELFSLVAQGLLHVRRALDGLLAPEAPGRGGPGDAGGSPGPAQGE